MKLIATLAVLSTLLIGCSAGGSQYQIGDMSRTYCTSTSPEYRATLRTLAIAAGVSMVDYCLAVGVPLVLLTVLQDSTEVMPNAPD